MRAIFQSPEQSGGENESWIHFVICRYFGCSDPTEGGMVLCSPEYTDRYFGKQAGASELN